MSDDPEAHPIFTIGHSTRPIAEFVDILRSAQVRHLVDVRSIPRSRTNPDYNLDTLPNTLAGYQIGHTIIPELGGRRPRQKEIVPEINPYWQNRSFHNYADYAMSPPFDDGLDQLVALSIETPCAIMCSEAVWWRCHRRIIADYLLMRRWIVIHLMGESRAERASMTPGAVIEGSVLTYPAVEAEGS